MRPPGWRRRARPAGRRRVCSPRRSPSYSRSCSTTSAPTSPTCCCTASGRSGASTRSITRARPSTGSPPSARTWGSTRFATSPPQRCCSSPASRSRPWGSRARSTRRGRRSRTRTSASSCASSSRCSSLRDSTACITYPRRAAGISGRSSRSGTVCAGPSSPTRRRRWSPSAFPGGRRAIRRRGSRSSSSPSVPRGRRFGRRSRKLLMEGPGAPKAARSHGVVAVGRDPLLSMPQVPGTSAGSKPSRERVQPRPESLTPVQARAGSR